MPNKVIKNWDRILITSPHNLGDLIAKLPFIRLLKAHYPRCHIIVCARNNVRELAILIDEIDEFIDFDHLFFQKDAEIVIALKKLHVDVILHLLSIERKIGPDIFKYAKEANIPHRIGNLNTPKISFWLKRHKHHLTHNLKERRIIEGLHEYQWNLLPLKFFGIENKRSIESISELLRVNKKEEKGNFSLLSKDKFNLIVHPGSNGNAKEWPESKFIELIDQLNLEKVNILVTGSLQEAARFKKLNFKRENYHFLMGQFTLSEFISLISQVDGLVAASTGPIHIASLFSIPTVALFPKQKEIGPSIWKPLGKYSDYIESSMICLACEKRLTDFNQMLCTCMNGIEVQQVQDVIHSWGN